MGYRSARPSDAEQPTSRTPYSRSRCSALAPQQRSPLDEPPPRRSTPATCSSTRSTSSCRTTATRPGSTGPSSTTCCTRRSPTPTAAEPESDLILDPDPDDATVRGRARPVPVPRRAGGVPEPDAARPGVGAVPVARAAAGTSWPASPRSCLRAVAETPDPDLALVNLEKVTASLGGKAVLWELFSFNPPSLKLYVDLCAGSQFLSRDPHQQPRHDRRAARQPGARTSRGPRRSCGPS